MIKIYDIRRKTSVSIVAFNAFNALTTLETFKGLRFYSAGDSIYHQDEFTLNGFKFKISNTSIHLMNPYKEITSVQEVKDFIFNVQLILNKFKSLDRDGYVNRNRNLEGVDDLIKCFKITVRPRSARAVSLNKWCYHFILLNLYVECIKRVDSMSFMKLSDCDDDIYTDLKVLSAELESLLDPSIKVRISKTGITVTRNTYVGYDTEYVLKNLSKSINDLLSIQLACNTRLLLKITKYGEFCDEYMHPLTGEIHDKGGDLSKNKILELVVAGINKLINDYRVYRFSEYDEFVNKL